MSALGIARIILFVAILVILLGRLQGISSKDRVANYIQECIEDPNINVYYDDNGHMVIDHLPHSSNTRRTRR